MSRAPTVLDLTTARALLTRDPGAAVAIARKLVAAHPGAIEPRFILGTALRRSGAAGEALAVLGPLAMTHPGAWGIHYEHGMALAMLDHSEAAVAALTRAVALNPGSFLAWHALGDRHLLSGNRIAAQDAFGRANAAGLADSALRATATAWLDGSASAGEMLRTRFGLDPNDPAAICAIADNVAPSEQMAALLAETPYLPARFRHALLQHRMQDDMAALQTIEPVIAARPGIAAPLGLRAAILVQLGREAAADADFSAAIAADPDDPALWHGHGHVLRALGRQDEAVAAYRRAIELAPGLGEAWWSLANLKLWRFDAADRARMAALLDEPLPSHHKSYLTFALAKASEDAGDHGAAFSHYVTANALRRETTPWDAVGHKAFVDRTIATCTVAFFEARRGSIIQARDPIFVLGLPRSGSTLVEQILASHSAVEGASELAEITLIAQRIAGKASYPDCLAGLPPETFATLGEEYLDRTRHRRPLGKAHFVDKFPGNFCHIPLIHLMFPGAAIIDVRRNPRAVCVSLFRQSFAEGQAYSYDLGDLGRYYVDYVRLMDALDRALPGRVLHLSYEAMIDDTEGQTRRLLDHVGLPFEPGVLRFFDNDRAVRTPSSEQVRQPIYRAGLDQWRHYSAWLGPLTEALGPLGKDGGAGT